MKELHAIIDTWNMIDYAGITNWKQEGNKVMISDSDFQKMLDSVKNKKYVNNLLASHGIMSTHGYIR